MHMHGPDLVSLERWNSLTEESIEKREKTISYRTFKYK